MKGKAPAHQGGGPGGDNPESVGRSILRVERDAAERCKADWCEAPAPYRNQFTEPLFYANLWHVRCTRKDPDLVHAIKIPVKSVFSPFFKVLRPENKSGTLEGRHFQTSLKR